MNSGKVEIEHPAKPNRTVIVRFLLLIMMANAKIVG